MYMGKKLTVLWDEGELGNSVMLFTCSCHCCCPSRGALLTQCPIGHLVEADLFGGHGSVVGGRWSGQCQGSVVGVGVLCAFTHYDYDC